MSINRDIEIAQVNKKIVKWLPRLDDESNQVREKAGDVLSLLALKNPDLRDDLIPVLMKKAAAETSWPVVCNGILYHLSRIPLKDSVWVGPFLSLYLDLIQRRDYAIRDNASMYVWEMIENGLLKRDHPGMPSVISLAQAILDQGGNDDCRLSLMQIIDWHED